MSEQTSRKPGISPSRGVAAFVMAQLLIVGVTLGGLTYRHHRLELTKSLPPLRETPLEIRPQLKPLAVEVISPEQLRSALLKIRPVLHADTGVAKVDHNLRFWGVEATFDDPQFVSGERMRDCLLDHNVFREVYGALDADKKPLMIDVDATGGIRVRDFEGKLSSSHDDHTMACLAEVGTPLSHPVITPSRRATFRQIVEQSLRDFSLNQVEYEWSALTYALYIKETNQWPTSEGQMISFDQMAERIMRQEMPQGVCFGNHRLHTLVMLLRVDDVWDHPTPMLSQEVRDDIVLFLQEMTIKLVAHQHADGFWNIDWPTSKPASRTPTDVVGDQLSDRIIATGHALEWWALVPEDDQGDIHPGDMNVVRDAAQWLVRTIEELPESDLRRYSAFLSHAGRALALWRGKFPHEIDFSQPAADAPPESPLNEEPISRENDEVAS